MKWKRVPSIQVHFGEGSQIFRIPPIYDLDLIIDERKSFVSSLGMEARLPPLSVQNFLAFLHALNLYSMYL